MTIILVTNRLELRTWSLDDSEMAFLIWGDAEVMQFVSKPFETKAVARKALKNAIAAQNRYGVCLGAVVEKSSRKIVGCCGFHRVESALELAFHFIPQVWGKGYATEAAKACLEYGFEKLDAEKIIAFVHPENIASNRVLEKTGMKSKGLSEIDDTMENLYELNHECLLG
jgi:RimJ/RimL family protein N-acetyltransferase